MKRLLWLLIIIAAVCSQAHAYEPNLKSALTSVKDSKVAFFGRVVAMKEVKRNGAEALAVLKVQQIRCIHAANCERGKIVRIDFVSQSHVERTMPVSFPLSFDVLFLIHRKGQQRHLIFNSRLGPNMDTAFVVEDSELDESFLNEKEVRLANIYLHQKRESVTWKQLDSIAHR